MCLLTLLFLVVLKDPGSLSGAIILKQYQENCWDSGASFISSPINVILHLLTIVVTLIFIEFGVSGQNNT